MSVGIPELDVFPEENGNKPPDVTNPVSNGSGSVPIKLFSRSKMCWSDSCDGPPDLVSNGSLSGKECCDWLLG